MTKEQFSQIIDNLIGGYDYNIKKGTSELISYQAAKSIALDKFNELTKRRPFLFTINKRHNGEQVVTTELFYLEPNEKPADFTKRAKDYITKMHGTGLIISKQEIRV